MSERESKLLCDNWASQLTYHDDDCVIDGSAALLIIHDTRRVKHELRITRTDTDAHSSELDGIEDRWLVVRRDVRVSSYAL